MSNYNDEEKGIDFSNPFHGNRINIGIDHHIIDGTNEIIITRPSITNLANQARIRNNEEFGPEIAQNIQGIIEDRQSLNDDNTYKINMKLFLLCHVIFLCTSTSSTIIYLIYYNSPIDLSSYLSPITALYLFITYYQTNKISKILVLDFLEKADLFIIKKKDMRNVLNFSILFLLMLVSSCLISSFLENLGGLFVILLYADRCFYTICVIINTYRLKQLTKRLKESNLLNGLLNFITETPNREQNGRRRLSTRSIYHFGVSELPVQTVFENLIGNYGLLLSVSARMKGIYKITLLYQFGFLLINAFYYKIVAETKYKTVSYDAFAIIFAFLASAFVVKFVSAYNAITNKVHDRLSLENDLEVSAFGQDIDGSHIVVFMLITLVEIMLNVLGFSH